MKYLLLLSSILLSVVSFSQDSIPKLTAAKVYQDAKDGFRDLVEKLEGPAKHTYEVYVRQHVVSGASYIIIACIMLTAFTILLRCSWNRAKIVKDGYLDYEWNTWAYARLVFAVGTLASFLLFCNIFWGDALSEIINPEYHAIQDIIKAFK